MSLNIYWEDNVKHFILVDGVTGDMCYRRRPGQVLQSVTVGGPA